MPKIRGGFGACLAAIDAQAVTQWKDRVSIWLLGGHAEVETSKISDITITKIVRATLRSCWRSTDSAMRESW